MTDTRRPERGPLRRLAIAAPNGAATAAGHAVVADGGNAIDAALAATMVALVTEPGVASLGGSAFLTVDPGDGSTPVTVDGAVAMPGLGLSAPERRRRLRAGGLRDVVLGFGYGTELSVGHAAVGTPGTPAALDLTHQRYGRAPWSRVVEPAIEVASRGWPLSRTAAAYLQHALGPVFGWHPQVRQVLHGPNGHPLQAGDPVLIPGLADFLVEYARHRSAAFYAGPLAKAIEADMAEQGGLLTGADLAAYRPAIRPSLPVQIGRWQVETNPPPSIGGPVLVAMLLLMADRLARGWDATDPAGLAHLVKVQQAVLQHRAGHLDVAECRIAAAHNLLNEVLVGGQHWLRGSPSTLHVSAVDSEGAACAITASSGYGSGVPTPGYGIWLNNSLGEHELTRPGLSWLRAGDRLASNMAPTVGRRDDGAVVAVGSPGADRITTATLQVLAPLLGPRLEIEQLQHWVDRPRLHVRLDQDPDGAAVVEHEPGLGTVMAGAQGLAALLPGIRWLQHPSRSMYFGGVALAVRDASGGMAAAGDPRREGVSLVG